MFIFSINKQNSIGGNISVAVGEDNSQDNK